MIRSVRKCSLVWCLASSLVAARSPSITSSSRRAAAYKVTPFGLTRPVDYSAYPYSHHTSTISISVLEDIRGGNVEQHASSSTPPPSTSFKERVGPYWKSFSKLVQEKTKLVQEKVEPAISDPRTNIWNPLKQFIEKQKEVAKERQVIVKQDPKQAAFLLLNPARFLKIGIAAWIVAEVLHGIGFFDNPDGVAPRLKELYKEHLDEGVSQVQYRLADWWEEERSHGGWFNLQTYQNQSLFSSKIRNMPRRYQFALGGAVGMLVSPVVWSCALKCTKFFIVTYLFSELNEYWKDSSSVGESAVEVLGFRGKGGDSINDFLEAVREAVRSTVLYPDKFWADTREVFTEDDRDGLSAGTKQGILLGGIIGVIV